MKDKFDLTITSALPADDSLVAQHFYQLWLDNNLTPEDIDDNWLHITREFIIEARQERSFRAFLGSIDKKVVASVSCQLYAGLYPSPFKPSFRHYGYIWNVFVDSGYRRQGIGTQLTQTAIDYLRTLDCTHVIFHASPQGKPVYENLGFVPKNEMILELK